MTNRTGKYLYDIDFSISRINELLDGRSAENLSWTDEDVLHRRFSIIGEALFHLRKEGIEFSSTDWAVNLRNTLVHQYDAVTIKTLLIRVKLDLPPLQSEVQKMLST